MVDDGILITTVRVDSIGRVMIPKPIREALIIEPGDLIKISIQKVNTPNYKK